MKSKVALIFTCGSMLLAQTPGPNPGGQRDHGAQEKPGQPLNPGPPPPASPAAQPAASADLSNLRFDARNIDKSANPCVDFYQYACGGWMKNNPIPPDQSRWGRFDALAERNRVVLREILEQASKPTLARDPITQKIGDYYAACMNEEGIDSKSLTPIQAVLDGVRALKDKPQLAELLASLHRSGVPALFGFGSEQDFKKSTEVIAIADQGGLGLPDRDYYLKTDQKSAELRDKYVAHVARMFELAGQKPEQAKAGAAVVLKLETELAKASLDRVSRRDPAKIYHRMSRRELESLNPGFRWNAYFTGTGAPAFESINVTWPDFFKAMNAAIDRASIEDLKTYLTWNLLHSQAPLLPTAFVNENFAFFGQTLTGAKELRPRWKRCTDLADTHLGEAVGRKFVERTFGEEGKTRTLRMVAALEKALAEDIRTLPWMTPSTRQKAMEKLQAITNKIGYPDRWRDYSSVTVKPDDAMGNAVRAEAFEFQRQLDKIGKPVDRNEWEMTPPTVNAYYHPLKNEINFPAGILQPPFFDNEMDDAVNFGGIGMVIGHELTHGFDDQGRQFDSAGNLRDWWTPQDAKEFESRAACFVDQYSKFSVAPGVFVNGKLTLGENTADNGGLRIALMALRSELKGVPGQPVDGFTPEQRLFLSLGQIWCQNIRDEAARLQVQTDPHSPARFRVNGVVVNMPEFHQAFSCKAGQPMVSENACRVW